MIRNLINLIGSAVDKVRSWLNVEHKNYNGVAINQVISVNSVLYPDSLLFAVGQGGKIYKSTDNGASWIVSYTTAANYLYTICYGVVGVTTIIVAGGTYGHLYYSTNYGNTWTKVSSVPGFGTTYGINKIIFANNTFLAVGAGGKIATSTDGSSWGSVTSPFGTTAINDVVFVKEYNSGSGKYILIGNSNKVAHTTTSSLSSLVLYTGLPSTGTLQYIDTYNGITIITNYDNYDIYVTTSGSSGASFTKYTVGLPGRKLYADGYFYSNISKGGKYLYRSSDGINWSEISSGPTGTVDLLLYSNNKFMYTDTINNPGYLKSNTKSGGVINFDMNNEDVIVCTSSDYIKTIKYVNSIYVSVGTGNTIATSIDGIDWIKRYPIIKSDINSSNYDIAYFNGDYFISGGISGYVLKTSDFITFTKISLSSSLPSYVFGIASTTTSIIATGKYGAIVRSTDGTTWNATKPYVSTSTPTRWSIVSNNLNTYVVVGDNGIDVSNDDGLTWTTIAFSTTYSSIAYGNGIFIAVGYSGNIIASGDNGLTWNSTILDSSNIPKITYDAVNDIFYVIAGTSKIYSIKATNSPLGVIFNNTLIEQLSITDPYSALCSNDNKILIAKTDYIGYLDLEA